MANYYHVVVGMLKSFGIYCFFGKRPLIPGVYLMIVNNYKTILTIQNDSLNPAHLVVIVQAESQAKEQMKVAIPFRTNPYM